MTVETSRPIQASNPADMYAISAGALGYVPEDSLVIMGLENGRTGPHLRIDLAGFLTRPQDIAARFAVQFTDQDATVVQVFRSTAPKEAPEHIKDRDNQAFGLLFLALGEIAHAPVTAVYEYGGGYARDMSEDITGTPAPYPGEIINVTHPAAREFMENGLGHSPQQALKALKAATAEPSTLQAVQNTTVTAETGLLLWSRVITGNLSAEGLTGQQIATLLAALEDSSAWAVIATAARGLEKGYELFQSEPGPTKEMPRSAWPGGKKPEWERIERMEEGLKSIVAYGSTDQAATVYAALAWAAFAKGRGSFQDALLKESQRLGHSVLAEAQSGDCGVSGWAVVRESAY